MKYAFLHIEKTGGSALRNFLGDKIVELEHRHGGWDYIRRHTEAPVITVLRHPVDRAISHYHWALNHWETLKPWIIAKDGKPTIWDFYREAPNHACQWNRQMCLLSGSSQYLGIAIKNLQQCHWVGVMERLDIPKANESEYPEYSPRDREEIASYCADDFAVYREALNLARPISEIS